MELIYAKPPQLERPVLAQQSVEEDIVRALTRGVDRRFHGGFDGTGAVHDLAKSR